MVSNLFSVLYSCNVFSVSILLAANPLLNMSLMHGTGSFVWEGESLGSVLVKFEPSRSVKVQTQVREFERHSEMAARVSNSISGLSQYKRETADICDWLK